MFLKYSLKPYVLLFPTVLFIGVLLSKSTRSLLLAASVAELLISPFGKDISETLCMCWLSLLLSCFDFFSDEQPGSLLLDN